MSPLMSRQEVEDFIAYAWQATGKHPLDLDGPVFLQTLANMRARVPIVPEDKRCLCGSGLPWGTRVHRPDGGMKTTCEACSLRTESEK